MSEPSLRPPTVYVHEKDLEEVKPRLKGSAVADWMTPRIALKAGWAVDFLAIIATAVLADVAYQFFNFGDAMVRSASVGIGLLIAINFVALLSATKRYRAVSLPYQGEQIADCLKIWLLVFALLAILGFTLKMSAEFSRGATILLFVFGAPILVTRRLIFAHIASRALANGWFIDKRVFILAESGLPSLSQSLQELQIYGLRPIRIYEFSAPSTSETQPANSLDKVLAQLIAEVQQYVVQDIYICVALQHQSVIDKILETLAILPISIHLLFDDNASHLLANPISNIGRARTVELARQPLSRGEQLSKRLLDLALASTAIILLCPLMLVTALLIKLDSQGPVFFLQRRNGFNGGTFTIFKYRTMTVMEDGASVQQTRRNDPRVTRLGRWLRRSSIDELPQLFNVLIGNMSLVGPRPHAAAHNTEYGARIVKYAFRHHVKPGITGWAQVKGFRGETRTIDLMERRVEHDIWYINNWSLLLDCKILVLTVLISFRQSSAY